MSALSLVIQREYFTRVKKKSFIILTLLMPLLFIAISFVPVWLASVGDKGTKIVAIVDYTGTYAPLFSSNDNFQFQVITANKKEAYQSKIGKGIFGVLQITKDLSEYPKSVSLLSEKQASSALRATIEMILNEKVIQQKLDKIAESNQLDHKLISEIRETLQNRKISLTTMKYSDSGDITETKTDVSHIIGMAFTLVIYMFLLMYGNIIMQAVIEEKKSRIVEVMVSSVKPVKLLMGKIIGIGLVGITQLAIWIALIGIFSSAMIGFIAAPDKTQSLSTEMVNSGIAAAISLVLSINWAEIVLYFVLFFIGGYILYASIFAMFASAVNSEEDTSQFMMPVTLIIAFAFLAGISSAENPDGPLAFWCSLIPFTSPIVMMIRIPFGIPLWEKLLSLLILYGTFIGISYLAAKIYRVGILIYGKKPSIKEMIKWLKYK